jgi:hypothetical protein
MIDDDNMYVYSFYIRRVRCYAAMPLLRFWEQVIYEIV